jgi:hypothetical protein
MVFDDDGGVGSDNITVTVNEPEYITVTIDIKPGSDSNPINLKEKGVIPVAILTTPDFDAATVDPLSVRFGPGEAHEDHKKGHIEDVDKDGDKDMVLHFKMQDTGIKAGDVEAVLVGMTKDGRDIRGTDSISTLPSKGGLLWQLYQATEWLEKNLFLKTGDDSERFLASSP